MSPFETVRYYMRGWPSHYPTRAKALLALFDNCDAYWHAGELTLAAFDLNQYTDVGGNLEDEQQYLGRYLVALQADDDYEAQYALRELLRVRQDVARVRFTYDNADWLARHTGSSLTGIVDFRGLHLQDMPADVSPEWHAAAVEVAQAVLCYRYVPNPEYNEDYHNMNRARADAARKVARRFLERLGIIQIDAHDRCMRLAKLADEARALGMDLVPAGMANGQ